MGGVINYTKLVYLNDDHKENNTVVVKYETAPNARVMVDGVHQLLPTSGVMTEIITKGGKVIKKHHDKNEILFKNTTSGGSFTYQTDLYRDRDEMYCKSLNKKTKNIFVNDQIKKRSIQKKLRNTA